MKTQTRPARIATLLTLSTLLAVPAFAAPHIDPKVIGHWRGTLPGPGKNNPQADLVLRPNGTETMSVLLPKHPIVFKATYTTAPGVLTMTRVPTPGDGMSTTGDKKQALKYKVTPTTLILDDGTPSGRVLFHRMKS